MRRRSAGAQEKPVREKNPTQNYYTLVREYERSERSIKETAKKLNE